MIEVIRSNMSIGGNGNCADGGDDGRRGGGGGGGGEWAGRRGTEPDDARGQRGPRRSGSSKIKKLQRSANRGRRTDSYEHWQQPPRPPTTDHSTTGASYYYHSGARQRRRGEQQEATTGGGSATDDANEAAAGSDSGEGHGGAQRGPLGVWRGGKLWGEFEAPGGAQGHHKGGGGEAGPGI